MNNPYNSDVAKNFRNDVDGLNSAYLDLVGMGVGYSFIKTVGKIFKNKANWQIANSS